MTDTKVKRSEILTYINTTPETPAIVESVTATYALLGEGIKSGKIALNPGATTEQYIDDDNASTSIDNYKPKMAVEMTPKTEDAAADFITQLRMDRAVQGAAETTIVNVFKYKTGTPPSYPAEEQKVAVSNEDVGGDGGAGLGQTSTLNYIGAPMPGTFNITTKVFAAT